MTRLYATQRKQKQHKFSRSATSFHNHYCNSLPTDLYCRALSMYSCCSIMTESAADTSIIFLEENDNSKVHWRKNLICCFLISEHNLTLSYCAVLWRIDVRRACSSVRAEGTLVVIQSVPFGGLLTGLGWGMALGISGFWTGVKRRVQSEWGSSFKSQ